ncbi:MAG: sugar phosphate isomerase/epimerase [Isosphaeraceae bacterium]|nr:sugar phosphate isomerase/epimerase [Isosphaeraceae bacterium]
MIRSLLGLRINPSPDRSLRDQIREAARLGAKGIVLDAAGDLSPDRLSETGRRELRHLLRTVELGLIALNLPTRRPFDTDEQLDDRLARADRAFAMAYELGTPLVLARVGAVPPEAEAPRREVYTRALGELARRADHRGVRLAVETGAESGEVLRGFLDTLGAPALAASVDPAALLRMGHDPVAAVIALGEWVAHAYANDATGPSGRAVIANPRGFGFAPGVLDWEEYLGALEEIDYRGYLTIWPDPALDQASQFSAIAERLKRY